jgi:hypothetical protein
MENNLKSIIQSKKIGRIAYFLFSVYILIWAIIEPIGLEWIEYHKNIWRIILLSISTLVTLIFSYRICNTLLDKIDTNGPDRTLQDSFSSTGNPSINIKQDGNLGGVLHIRGQFNLDEMDWLIKSNAQKAKQVELIFKTKDKFCFYIRVILLSQNEDNQTFRWIRFDNSIAKADNFINDPHEMGTPFDSTLYKTFNKVVINIPDAIMGTFGQAGWKYNKSLLFRIRCNDAEIKSLVFKK